MIRQIPEQPAAERSHQESRRKQQCGIELLHHGVGIWKEVAGEIKRKCSISIEVIPFDEIADGANENGLDAPPHIRKIQMILRAVNSRQTGHCSLPLLPGCALKYC